jgi:murein L,D-transpeptidase YcbB/YkuD
MAVQFLSPGQTHDDVTRMKRRLVTRLLKLGFDPIAQKITIKSTTYGPVAEEGVRRFQRAKNLQHVDGLVGEDTWRALVRRRTQTSCTTEARWWSWPAPISPASRSRP